MLDVADQFSTVVMHGDFKPLRATMSSFAVPTFSRRKLPVTVTSWKVGALFEVKASIQPRSLPANLATWQRRAMDIEVCPAGCKCDRLCLGELRAGRRGPRIRWPLR